MSYHASSMCAAVSGSSVLRPRYAGVEPELTMGPSPPAWLDVVGAELERFSSFDENWDSYGAPRIDVTLIRDVVDVLPDIVPSDAPRPAISLTGRGGIQLEWRVSATDIELEFLPTRSAELLVVTHEEEEEAAFDLINIAPLRRKLDGYLRGLGR